MTTPFTTDMTATDLELVVTDVLAVLELPFVETSGTEEFSAWLTIHGPADIALTVSADHAGATAIAQAFFGDDFEDGDQADAMKEIANVCAGGCKTMIEGEWTIGIPDAGTAHLAADALHATCPAGAGRILVGMGNKAD